ncbi:MAG: sodium:solute symporter family protein [Planctomycetota bacterium]|jgi:SSS family transporter
MELSRIDWAIVIGYCAISVAVGFVLARRAKGSVRDFFLSGSTLPWWVIGTSMVATTFAADTPLTVTEFVRGKGIWGNWFIWSYGLMHLLAVVLFSRLWRRLGVVTDQELVEIRYAGRPARILRIVKAGYLATLYNFIVMGWVINAMATILEVTTGTKFWEAVIACVAVAAVYSVLSGFWGVVATDLIQFGLALGASIVLAVFAVDRVGGMGELVTKVTEAGGPDTLRFLPTPPDAAVTSYEFWASPFGIVLGYLVFLWWASHNADGGGMIIQRMLAAKDERHARLGTLWFALGHYAIRFWPWVVVAAASIVILPEVASDKAAYPTMVNELLPVGLKGLLVAAFFAAFMSTIDTHVNWGASYLVNDVYRRFIKREATNRHYVLVSRVVVLALTVLGALLAFQIRRIETAWFLVASMGAGVGLILVLRWFWWRVNAWSELSALSTSVVLGLAFHFAPEISRTGLDMTWVQVMPGPLRIGFIALASVAVSLVVTRLTAPVPVERLRDFYRRARPGGFWRPVVGDEAERTRWGRLVLEYLAGVALVFGTTFGIGSLIFGAPVTGAVLLALAALGALTLHRAWRDVGV